VGISPQSAMDASDFKLMREAGVQSVRLPLEWNEIQPESPLLAEPDWGTVDHQVQLAAEAGLRAMPVLVATPRWVAPLATDLPVRSAWQRWAWASFVREAVERYGPDGSFWEEHDRIPFLPMRRWEIWNEQNIVTFSSPVDPARYAIVLRIAGGVLHSNDPGS